MLLQSERGYHVMLPRSNVTLQRSLTVPAHGVAIVPMRHGLRISGTVELARRDSPPNPGQARRLIEGARQIFRDFDDTGAAFWMGRRPSLPDGLPIIDRASRCGNVLYAFGHAHMGLSWAATTGRLVSAMAKGTRTDLDTAPFRLDRFRLFSARPRS